MFGEKEWYFFSPRDRKYPNGTRPNRVAGSGYWKATGTDKLIMSEGRKVGIKKALVFYIGKAPRGSKTNWIMHEYRLSEPSKNNNSSRLDDWVLCRIYKKNSSAERAISSEPSTEQSHGSPSTSSSQFDGVLDSLPAIDNAFLNFPASDSVKTFNEDDQKVDTQKPDTGNYDWLGVGAFGLHAPHSTSMDPTFNMQREDEGQNGIRSQRMENSGYSFSQRFMSGTDPFAIRYPTQSSSSGYRQ